jgi:hypothetical protein
MTEFLPTAGRLAADECLLVIVGNRRTVSCPRWWFVLLVTLLVTFGGGSPGAHDIIDTDQVNGLIAAADQATTHIKEAVGPAAEGEARFAFAMVLVDATDILNRDLAAHDGLLTVNTQLLLKALTQRNQAPRFGQAIGRYRLPRAPLEDAIRLAPDAPYVSRARFALLKAGFYESFVLDPFELIGISFNDLERQIAEAEALSPALSSADDAEEASFIRAVDLARAAQLAPAPEVAGAYVGKAQKALAAFAENYPESMRAAAARMILKKFGGVQ